MAERVGVYVCHCGSNIAGKVDVEEVARWARENLSDVAVSRDHKFMCSALGQALIEEDIKKAGLTRIVVAACSPHLHEPTFRRACSNAGLNPYLMQMTSLREQVSWVTKDREMATDKAKAMVSGAVERVKHQEPLEPQVVDVTPATLVVGGGIAGIQAALELADAGYPVYLVEREPSIGGHMAQFDKTFPTLDCAACILTPRMSEVVQHEKITLLTYSELEEVNGSVGNFQVKIRKKARYVNDVDCTGCGLCQEKCPRKVLDETFEVGMGQRKSIYMPFPQAVPRIPVIDRDSCIWFERGKCGACKKLCPTHAIEFDQEDEVLRVGGRQPHHGHRLRRLRCEADVSVRLRSAGQRVHQSRIRANVQCLRPNRRQDRVARRQDRARIDRRSCTAWAAGIASTTRTAPTSAA